MVIVERPIESYSKKYIGKLVDLKLHDPHEFEITISEVEQNTSSLLFQKIMQSIDQSLTREYKVRHFNEYGFDYSNSSNYVCLDNSKLEYPDQLKILKFWLNRVGVVSIITYLDL